MQFSRHWAVKLMCIGSPSPVSGRAEVDTPPGRIADPQSIQLARTTRAQHIMSLLFLVVVAAPVEAPAIVAAEEPEARWSTQTVSVADELNLAALSAALKGRPYNADDVRSFVTLAKRREGSTWIVLVPDRLTELLAKLGDTEVQAVAARWKEMPVVKERGGYEPAFHDGLAKLRKLAIQARSKGKALLIQVTV